MKVAKAVDTVIRLGKQRNMVGIVRSSPGIGKTEIALSIAQRMAREAERECAFLAFYPTSMEPAEIQGLPWIQKKTLSDGSTRLVAVRTFAHMIDVMWEEHNQGKMLFVCIEEAHQAEASVQKAMRSLYDSRKLGLHECPPDTCLFGLTNRMEDNSGVELQLAHNMNVQCVIEGTFALSDWMTWADSVNHPPVSIRALEDNVSQLCDIVPADPNTPYYTARSHVRAINALVTLSNDPHNLDLSNYGEEVIAGFVGTGVAPSLISSLRLGEHLPRASEILADPTGCKRIDKKRPDLQATVCHVLTQLLPSGEHMGDYGELSARDKQAIDAVFAYMDYIDLPAAFQTTVWERLITKTQAKITAHPTVQKMVSNQQHLLASVV